MNPQLEQPVRDACEAFQTFVLVQIIGAWFADSPNPQGLINECITAWRTRLQTRYEAIKKSHFEQTGIVSASIFEEVADEAEKRLRKMLDQTMREHQPEKEASAAGTIN